MFKRLVVLMMVLTFSGSVNATPVDILRQQTASGDKPEIETPNRTRDNTQQSETQQAGIQQAIADATQDANAYDAVQWGVGSAFAGACFPIVGPIIVVNLAGRRETPPPPASRIMGKTPEYVSQYTATYDKLIKRKRADYTATGGVIGTAVTAVIVLRSLHATGGSGGSARNSSSGGSSGGCASLSGCNYFGYGFRE